MLLALNPWWQSAATTTVDLAADVSGTSQVSAALLIRNAAAAGIWPLPEEKRPETASRRVVAVSLAARATSPEPTQIAASMTLRAAVRVSCEAIFAAQCEAAAKARVRQGLSVAVKSGCAIEAQNRVRQPLSGTARSRSATGAKMRVLVEAHTYEDEAEAMLAVMLALEEAA